MARGHHAEPLQRIRLVAGAQFIEPIGGVRELRFEFDRHFRANFVTAAANRRADRGKQIPRFRAELHPHLADGFRDDALKRAAPTRMNSANHSLLRIDEENGNAIGGLHAEEQARLICDGSVAAARFARRGVECMNDVGMKLFERREREIVCAECGLKPAPVF